MSRQLALDLPVRQALGREAFFVAPSNALALAALDDRAGWPEGKLLLLGPPGSGKTHLAQVWRAETGAALTTGATVAGADLPALAAAGAVVVEDAEAASGDAAAEAALFHLHNLVLAEGGRLLLTSAKPAPLWGLRLPDLASRIAATATARLEAPDDALLAAVLVKLFADRQVTVAPALIGWLVARMDRSLAAAREVVAALDARALAEGRPITRALAAEVVAELLDSAGARGQ